MSNLSLQNLENYKSEYTHSSVEIFTKYVGIINEYFLQCLDTLQLRDLTYYKYIIYKGLETITHVFKMLILYTKNLNITYTFCQKSLYYYVEFICQIDNDNHSFLQLNSKDAALFVYKKTIFEINNEYRKEFVAISNACDITTNIDLCTQLYYNIITSLLNEYEFTQTNKNGFIQYVTKNTSNFVKNLLNLSLHKTELEFMHKLRILAIFNEKIKFEITKKQTFITYLANKLKKKNTSIENIKRKLAMNDTTKYSNKSYVKFVNWLLTDSP